MLPGEENNGVPTGLSRAGRLRIGTTTGGGLRRAVLTAAAGRSVVPADCSDLTVGRRGTCVGGAAYGLAMIDRRQVMHFRVQAQQLDRTRGTLNHTAVLDIGVQDTGPDGGLGRPGAVLIDGELVGTWRPRQSGNKLTVAVHPWQRLSGSTRKAVIEQAERLAAHREISLSAVDFAASV